ncbi:MAG: nicotinate phosphoribosyltransferase [Candidatus Omnitrophica bacterium]|nr:nicotinate phosphoribosyltransferase [Candidatus Omnitrophota bacterium]MBD3268852.1 nicotinate phosphoribosyltransferase [Candidatus Omnitrophota bacterium]
MNNTGKPLSEGILFTDLYQLTMAQLYYYKGLHEKEAQFDYFFRNYPSYDSQGSKAGYCVNAGLDWLLEWMGQSRFGEKEISYLEKQKGRNKKPLFKKEFLKWLGRKGDFSSVSLKAIPEGRVVHPNVPLLTSRGPLAIVQILESSLLNHLNFQTLIATKASRIKEAASGGMVIDFGMRRAQGKGAISGARAALIGGVDFSSNAGISYSVGFPPKGTHAHSMVQAFMALGAGELAAFKAYSEVYPDDCLLLVDTIDTLGSGIPNAIKVFERLKAKGHKPLGVRLDSGDLAYLSIQAAKMLNKAGFKDTSIVLSNKLDEVVIWQILSQIRKESSKYGVDADSLIKRLVYGVGTKLITSGGDAALDGVYKLTALKEGGEWKPAIKLSETPAKIINPGFKKVWRIYDKRDKAVADLLSLDGEDIIKDNDLMLHHPVNPGMKRLLRKEDISGIEPLLIDVLKEGKRVKEGPTVADIRKAREKDIERLDTGIKRLLNPHIYHVSLSEKLWSLKQNLINSQKS